MRKAGAKEGSIGSKGAVDVNRSPVSTAIAGGPSDLMIKFCTSSGGSSSSSLRSLKNTDISMTCKGWTGELTTDRGGPSCSSKLNGMGLELPRPIDPDVRWKNVSKRQRAARRARTFFGEDRRKNRIGSFYLFGSAMKQETTEEDAPVSESEKLGVSILGRRFSDPTENVPIKKRRFHMDCSPSPPPTPLLVDPYEKILGSSSRSIRSYEKHKVKMLGSECKDENRGPFDDDDFSGISILAAAACESEMDGDILNGACSTVAHSLPEGKLESTTGSTKLSLLHDLEDKLNVPGTSHHIYDMPPGSSNYAPDMKSLFVAAPASSENPGSSPNAYCSFHSALNSVNKAEMASDAKSSSVAMENSPGNPEKSIGCPQDADTQANHANATRDSRLHWDLNVAMEAWETDCGGDDDPTIASVSDRNDAGIDMDKPETSYDRFVTLDTGDVANPSVDIIQMADVPKDVCLNTKDEDDSPADSLSHPLLHQSSQNLQLLKPESLRNNDLPTMDLPDQQKNRFASVIESHIGSNPEPALIMEHLPSANVEKIDGSQPPPVDCEDLSRMSSVNGNAGCNSLQTSELGSMVKPLASRLVSEESTNLPTVTPLHKKVTDFGWSDNKLEEGSEQSISEFKNQELLDVDSGTSKMDQSVSKSSDHGTDVFYVKKSSDHAENLTHPEDNPGSSDYDMAHVHGEGAADAMINSKDCLITCANSSSAETYCISGMAQVPVVSSECHKPGVTDADSIVDSRENENGKVASNICFEQCYETDTSHISESIAGLGKVDVEEDDSQYEDGELRESGDRYWVGDGYEEVKRSNWHCQVSDYNNEATIPGLVPPPVDSVSKNVGTPGASYNETQSRREHVPVSPITSKRSWLTNCLDGGPVADGKAQNIHSRGDTQIYGINPGRVAVGSAAAVSQSERCNDVLGDDLLSIRMRNSGWDMLPEGEKHSECDPRNGADLSNRCILSSLDAAGDSESLRKMSLSNKDVQRVERQKSFERPHRNELSRSDDGYGSGSKVERTIDSQRSHGVYDASRHIQAGNRGEWMENSKHPCSARRKSQEHYNYGPSGPRNAAEAAVAKMESNGFVVARDGTLVRAVDSANAGQMARRMRNTLNTSYRSLSGRGSPIDRDGACGMSRGPVREASPERHFGANSNRSGRYGTEMEKEHTANSNLSSARCSLPNRQRGIQTARASLNLSRAHNRSPSGSRSRSPQDWASPRNRRKIVENGGSALRRNSRSPPNRMAKVRMGRLASPQRQHGYDDRSMRYSPPSRNHTYSQQTSTWVDGRNGSTVDLSDHNKRYSRRSPPLRITPQNDRFDVMDSQGRSRSGEFYRSTQGRLPYVYDRASKHERNGDDQREYADRYGSQSVKPYDRNVKQFRNNTGDKFRTRISAPRSPEPQRRVSPRRFDRSFER